MVSFRRGSVAESMKSGHSNASALEDLRKSRKSFFTGDKRKSRKSIGAYTSLFSRKLLPPIGFYREADKYHQMTKRFEDDPDKLEALEEMWNDYQKYQIRKRFRWPPNLICKKFFWTTGYYADYQKESRATRLRKPGEDSSDDEFIDPGGQFQIAGNGDDINVEEFERYRQAKKQNISNPDDDDANRKRMTRFFGEDGEDGQGADDGKKRRQGGKKGKALKGEGEDDLGERRPTLTRLFDDNESEMGSSKSEKKRKKRESKANKNAADPVEEVETTVQVEYTLIKDPNKKKKKKKSKAPGKSLAYKDDDDKTSVASSSKPKEPVAIPGLTIAESAKLAKTYDQALAAGTADPTLIARRKSMTKTFVDPNTGEKVVQDVPPQE